VSLYCLHLLQSGFKQTRAVELKTLMFHLIFSSLFLSLSLFLFTRQIPGAVAMTIIKKNGTYDSTVYQCTFQNVRLLLPHDSTPHINRITLITKRLVTN